MRTKKPQRPGSGHDKRRIWGLRTPAEEFNQNRHAAEAKGRRTRRGKLSRLYANNARIMAERRAKLLSIIGLNGEGTTV